MRVQRFFLSAVIICHVTCILACGLEVVWSVLDMCRESLVEDLSTSSENINITDELTSHACIIVLLNVTGFFTLGLASWSLRTAWILSRHIATALDTLHSTALKYLIPLSLGGVVSPLVRIVLCYHQLTNSDSILPAISTISGIFSVLSYIAYMHATMWIEICYRKQQRRIINLKHVSIISRM